ncbi:MAG: HprK-related kinase A [Steroidobacteraceae bacterium]
MIVADLPPALLTRHLNRGGLRLRTGPVVTSVRSSLASVARGIALHYAAHPVESADSFADFHVSVERPRTVRRWINRQVEFRFDGQTPFTPLPGGQGFPMLEWGLNWCVSSHCHQYLILHAAVLERGGRALILPAPSGSGKSSLAAGLAFRGWRLLSDELALIDLATGAIVALPRPISLKNASIAAVRAFAPQAEFGPVVHETVKGDVAHVKPPADAVQRADEHAMPGWVVLPRYVPDAEANFAGLSKARTFMQLVDNAFNYNVHGRRGFSALAALIDRVDCREFSYSRLADAATLFERLATTPDR